AHAPGRCPRLPAHGGLPRRAHQQAPGVAPMKKALAGALRIGVPLALGLWLVYYFYRQLGMQQRAELFQAVRDAHWGWLLLSIGIGWCSHLSRAWRWRYLLGPLGHDVRLAN